MAYRCKCGCEFDNIRWLREHIALLTPRWPAQRCTAEHHDPDDIADVNYWTKRAERYDSNDRRFK